MRNRLSASLAIAAVASVAVATAPTASAQDVPVGSATVSLPAVPGLPQLPTQEQVFAQLRAMVPAPVLAQLGLSAPAAAAGPGFQDVSYSLPAAVSGEVNSYRRSLNMGTLGPDPELDGIAQGWANHLGATNTVEHNHAVLSRGMGENIVVAPANCNAACLVTLWKNSPGHNENLVDRAYRSAGIGMARNAQGMLVIVQDYRY